MKNSFHFTLFLMLIMGSLKAQVGTGYLAIQYGPSLNTPRISGGCELLPDGRVAVFGGHTTSFALTTSAEIWDSVSNTWTSSTMTDNRDGNGIARLNDGRYLLFGGCSSGLGVGQSNTAEIFNPIGNTFTPASGVMNYNRTNCRGVTLSSGKVLVIGNWYASSISGEVFDPVSGNFTSTNNVQEERSNPLMFPTSDGNAIVAGGYAPYGTYHLKRTEIFDTVTSAFTTLSSQLIPADTGWLINSATFPRTSESYELPNGKFVFLGYRNLNTTATQYGLLTFDPVTKLFSKLNTGPDSMIYDPSAGDSIWYCMNLVVDKNRGVIYFWGGKSFGTAYKYQLYAYHLANNFLYKPTSFGVFGYQLYSASATILQNGKIMYTGGSLNGDNFSATDSVLIVTPDTVSMPPPPTGLRNYSYGENHSVSPNPAKERCMIYVKENSIIQIFDLQGRELLNQRIYSSSLKGVELSLNDFAPGLYVIQVNESNQVWSRKLVIAP